MSCLLQPQFVPESGTNHSDAASKGSFPLTEKKASCQCSYTSRSSGLESGYEDPVGLVLDNDCQQPQEPKSSKSESSALKLLEEPAPSTV